MGNFTFNSISAADMGLVVEKIPRQYVPRKRLTSISIPGRSGNLHQWDGSWENCTQSYQCWFKASPVAGQAHKIKQWLAAAPAGARLEDTYDSTVYRLATYAGGADIENVRDRFGRFTITFDCAPQAYLKSGETALNITSSGLLNNPSKFPSYPLIELTGSVSGVVKIGDASLTIVFADSAEHTIYVDCELREVWEIIDGVEVYTNTIVASREFPRIEPGSNRVEITGGIESVRIYPRWWTL